MEEIVSEEHHIVLEMLINFLLFEKIKTPQLRKDQTYKLGIHIVEQMNSIAKNPHKIDIQALASDFENSCRKFVGKVKKIDRLNLLHCYGSSNIRTFNTLLSMFSPSMIPEFDLHENNEFRDSKIALELVWEKKLPNEVRLYLKTQFTDFLSYIPLNSDRLPKEQYEKIIQNFAKNLSHQEATEKIFFGYE